MSTALVSASSSFVPPQIEGANFLNLMIIDDERAIREVCKEVAQSMGFNSCVADSAEHGYRMLETQNIDVVLLDLKLPKVDGLEVLKEIRGNSALTTLPVVMLTSSSRRSDLEAAYKSGANSYLIKSTDFLRFKRDIEQMGRYWLGVNQA